ncbi:unnamed protein product [Phytophthora fragariaefolia]|uniref:Unnamed protein product n=1 Tax=Phytophthora fragariaefolia TaxID=1490495 RepID=A0A9W6Y8T7_9STRA|nr:unnamed protein product [Phytophthora fragariaefolia]
MSKIHGKLKLHRRYFPSEKVYSRLLLPQQRNEPIGTDAAGRSYFILEDAATVPNAAVWVCRCAKIGGTDWETVCNDLESVESLVQELSLSVESADLQLWQALSRGALRKLTRQQEKRRRNERWKFQLATSGVLDSSGNYEGIGRRSLRSRTQVNYANIDVEEAEEGEEVVAESDKSGDDEEAFEATSDAGADAESETDGDEDDVEYDEQPRRSTKKRKAPTSATRRSKRIRQSVRGISRCIPPASLGSNSTLSPAQPHESVRRSTRSSTRSRATTAATSSSQDEDDVDSEGDSD